MSGDVPNQVMVSLIELFCSLIFHVFDSFLIIIFLLCKQEHQQSVVDLLEWYLKSVCQIYTELHMTRMKRMMDSQKMSRLESDTNTPIEGPDVRQRKTSNESVQSGTMEDSLFDRKATDEQDSVSDPLDRNADNAVALAAARSAALAELAAPFAMEDDQLSAEELQMFESENAHLYNELNSLSDEVNAILLCHKIGFYNIKDLNLFIVL